MKNVLLIGLGNPGREYEATRHNVGFRLLDRLARHCRISLGGRRLADYGQGSWEGIPLVLVKPLTYMNRSGRAVVEVLNRFEASPEALLVACDDVNLPLGDLRLRPRGSSGGHKGLQSIIEHLGTEDFARLRLGVGGAPPDVPLEEYVLEAFAPDERDAVEGLLERALEAVLCFIKEPVEVAMSRYNQRLAGGRSPEEQP